MSCFNGLDGLDDVDMIGPYRAILQVKSTNPITRLLVKVQLEANSIMNVLFSVLLGMNDNELSLSREMSFSRLSRDILTKFDLTRLTSNSTARRHMVFACLLAWHKHVENLGRGEEEERGPRERN